MHVHDNQFQIYVHVVSPVIMGFRRRNILIPTTMVYSNQGELNFYISLFQWITVVISAEQ